MIYSGSDATGPVTTGTGTQIGTKMFNGSSNDNMYVGLKYSINDVHGLEINSTILGTENDSKALYGWYKTYIADKGYNKFLDKNVGFCGDRYPSTDINSSNGSGGIGTTTTYYGTYIRLVTNKKPIYNCKVTDDLYTTTDSNTGNKSLQYPIGLISADEVAFAGSVFNIRNSNFYLNTGYDYWTMSPSHVLSGYAYVFHVYSTGYISAVTYGLYNPLGVRPVINLRSDVSITGSGTTTDPYEIN